LLGAAAAFAAALRLTAMSLQLSQQTCANCRFARRSAAFDADGLLSCRYLPPQPSRDNNWRIVPENFWCGCWDWGPPDPLVGPRPPRPPEY
jgi:hypothetical protein